MLATYMQHMRNNNLEIRVEKEMTDVAFYVVRISDIKRETNQQFNSSFNNDSVSEHYKE